MILFDKMYDAESLYDLTRDMYEAINEEYNPELRDLPKDEHGFTKGRFTVIISWDEDEE